MALTPTHDVLIAGVANYNFPVTSDAYNSHVPITAGGGALGFFAKVSEDGTQLLYSSAFGPSSSMISISGIGEDPSGNVNCGNGPLTISSLQLTSDVFAFQQPARQQAR
jgi:hypothetical protein